MIFILDFRSLWKPGSLLRIAERSVLSVDGSSLWFLGIQRFDHVENETHCYMQSNNRLDPDQTFPWVLMKQSELYHEILFWGTEDPEEQDLRVHLGLLQDRGGQDIMLCEKLLCPWKHPLGSKLRTCSICIRTVSFQMTGSTL